MAAIHYAEYYNPHSAELEDDVFNAVLDWDNNIMHENTNLTPVAEYLLGAVRRQSGWSDEVAEWERAAAGWIPAPVQSWWFEQFSRNPGMEDASAEWWQTQPLGAVAAWRDNQPIGAVALTQIFFGDRDLQCKPNRPLFNEIRGLVVDPQFRNSEYRVGAQLVRRIVDMGNQLQGDSEYPLATIAVTGNPRAALTFEASGAVSDPKALDIALTTLTAKTVACWRSWQSHTWPRKERCDICPTRDDQLWLWSTKSE